MPTHTSLKGVTSVRQSLLSDQLEANVVHFFNWALLGVGGWFDVGVGDSGAYGGAPSRLRPATDPNYTDGQVWDGFRKDWVWETGVESSAQPVRVSGVYVNNVFCPTTGVAHSHRIDYPNGRVIFDTAVSQTGVVKAEFSYRLFQFYTADTPWWQRIQHGSFRVDDSHFLQLGSGAWDVPPQNRVQLPAVVVEAVPTTRREGKAIGGGTIVKQDVLFHIFSEDKWHFKWLHDAITSQWPKRLQGFDKNLLFEQDKYPLELGTPRASGLLMYPDLVKPTGEGGFYWEQIRIQSVRSTEQQMLGGAYFCTVRMTCEVDQE